MVIMCSVSPEYGQIITISIAIFCELKIHGIQGLAIKHVATKLDT